MPVHPAKVNGSPKGLKMHGLQDSTAVNSFPRIQKSAVLNWVHITSVEIKFTQVVYLNINHTLS